MTISYRNPQHIHSAPRPHWVGNGFHVNPMFNHMVGDKRTDPFLMLDYASPQYFTPNQGEPRGVGQHPHKGFETVTIAYKGEVAHRDSSGGGGIIKTGDVQWMTAGNGIIHEEFHSKDFSLAGGDFEMVQLWVNLPAKDKGTPAKYQLLQNDDIPVVTLTENDKKLATLRLIAGEMQSENQASTKGLGTTFTPINLWDVDIEPNTTISLVIPQTHNLILLVRQGDIIINDNADFHAFERELVTFEMENGENGTDTIRLTTNEKGSQIVLMSGEPLNEPIVGYGPFVMNSEQEIRQAVLDFNAGKFGQI